MVDIWKQAHVRGKLNCVHCDWFAGRPDDVCILYDEVIEEPMTTDCGEWIPQDD
jgi:hypothetical protein